MIWRLSALAFVTTFLITPAVGSAPVIPSFVITKHTSHPDESLGNTPEWMLPGKAYQDFYTIRKLMNITRYYHAYPYVRLWSNVSEEEHQKICPQCNRQYNEIASHQIWMIPNSTREDMVSMIIMYFQLLSGRISESMLYSATASGERKFLIERWKETQRARQHGPSHAP